MVLPMYKYNQQKERAKPKDNAQSCTALLFEFLKPVKEDMCPGSAGTHLDLNASIYPTLAICPCLLPLYTQTA